MNTTVDELKAYYVAHGGEAASVADVATIPDMIAAITALGSELPAVSADDNGKVMTVVEGAWNAAGASGGGDTFIVKVNRQPSKTAAAVMPDKTLAEIYDAIMAGKTVVAEWYAQVSQTDFQHGMLRLETYTVRNDSLNAVMFTAITSGGVVGNNVSLVLDMLSMTTSNSYLSRADISATKASSD